MNLQMRDEATLRVMRRTAAEVEQKSNCVRAMRAANQRPSADLMEELQANTEFLSYLNEIINSP